MSESAHRSAGRPGGLFPTKWIAEYLAFNGLQSTFIHFIFILSYWTKFVKMTKLAIDGADSQCKFAAQSSVQSLST